MVAVLESVDFAPAAFVAGVESRLRAVLADERRRWAALDPWLADVVDSVSGAVLDGGKRLRPLFCGHGYLAAGGLTAPAELVDVATALELLHAFALVHDDVMDGSPTRRGRPSLHARLMVEHTAGGRRGEARRHGEGVAVLVGDLAFALAQRLVAGAQAAVGEIWHELCTELVMGQYLDVAGAARGGVSRRRALTIARYKSGAYTVERPMQLGAAVAGRGRELASPISAFARPLGEAFQLRDDLLGVFGDEARTGKPAGDDLRAAKPTLLLAIGAERATGPARSLLDRVGMADLGEDEICDIRGFLVDCGARAEVERLIGERYRDAIAALDTAPIAPAARPLLAELAGRTLWRVA